MIDLDVRDVAVSFGGADVLDGASLTVDRGEIVALLGPSGSGKSTMLRVIAGIVVPDRGTIHVRGSDVTRSPTHLRDVGMVFQDNQLFPHLTVAENVAFGPRIAGETRDRQARIADRWLGRVGLDGFGSRSVTDLSGGEAKRVALARTLASEPAVVLLDEPLTGLDRELHDRLTVDLEQVLRDAGATALLVTHDRDEAAAIADRIVTLDELHR